MPEPWQVLSSRTIFSSPWLRLRQDAVRLPSGLQLDDYYVVEQPNFVKIFAFTAARQVVFVRQYKHGAAKVLLELPAGFIEPGESPGHAAARELSEETGYTGDLRPVGVFEVNPTREPTLEHLFFGPVRLSEAQRLDASEDIEVVLLPAGDVEAMLRRGDVSPLSTVSCALFCLPLMDAVRG